MNCLCRQFDDVAMSPSQLQPVVGDNNNNNTTRAFKYTPLVIGMRSLTFSLLQMRRVNTIRSSVPM